MLFLQIADLLVIPAHAPYKSDLPAIDILRERDMGLPPYNDFREACGLGRVDSFEDLWSIIKYPEEVQSKILCNFKNQSYNYAKLSEKLFIAKIFLWETKLLIQTILNLFQNQFSS